MTDGLPAPPRDDADVPRWTAELGLPGLVDMHVHFLPERVLRKVWAYFDEGDRHYGMSWPITYRFDGPTRVEVLRRLPRRGAGRDRATTRGWTCSPRSWRRTRR